MSTKHTKGKRALFLRWLEALITRHCSSWAIRYIRLASVLKQSHPRASHQLPMGAELTEHCTAIPIESSSSSVLKQLFRCIPKKLGSDLVGLALQVSIHPNDFKNQKNIAKVILKKILEADNYIAFASMVSIFSVKSHCKVVK